MEVGRFARSATGALISRVHVDRFPPAPMISSQAHQAEFGIAAPECEIKKRDETVM